MRYLLPPISNTSLLSRRKVDAGGRTSPSRRRDRSIRPCPRPRASFAADPRRWGCRSQNFLSVRLAMTCMLSAVCSKYGNIASRRQAPANIFRRASRDHCPRILRVRKLPDAMKGPRIRAFSPGRAKLGLVKRGRKPGVRGPACRPAEGPMLGQPHRRQSPMRPPHPHRRHPLRPPHGWASTPSIWSERNTSRPCATAPARCRFLVPVLDPRIPPEELAAACDGFLFTGSLSNVAPKHYGGVAPRDGVLQDEAPRTTPPCRC